MKNSQRGFIPMLIVLIVALIVVIGGGVYIAKHNSAPNNQYANNTQVQGNANANANANISTGNQTGTLRSLLAMGRDLTCTTNQASASGTMSGTTYMSGSMMRGDFTMTDSSNRTVDSHVIKIGDVIYSWTGTQGAKMNVPAAGATTSVQIKGSVNLDQNVGYNCQSWTKDDTKFSIPSTVTFIDLGAMMKGKTQTQTQGKVQIPVQPY